MTEKETSTDIDDMYKNTYCFTYEVTMVIQVLAPTQEVADAKLNQDGGYISKRDVKHLNTTALHQEGIEHKEVVEEEKDI
jgi:hypothetical protein